MLLEGEDFRRLRWRCMRRGLLELDIALTRFLDNGYAELDSAQAATFSELVVMEDPELLDLLTGRTPCANPAHAEVLAMLRAVGTSHDDAR